MKIAERRVQSFLAKLPDGIRAVLFHGPNRGLARERVTTLISKLVPDLNDPFMLAIPDRSALKAKPSLLADEAAMIAPYGQRRVVWLKDCADEDEAALACMLASGEHTGMVVLEAGELTARGKLRRLAESHKDTAVIGCYLEDNHSIEQLIRHHLHDRGLAITQEALNDLVTRLAGDRMLIRSELDKLALYCTGLQNVELADSQIVISDSSETEWEELSYKVLTGQIEASETSLSKLLARGAQPVSGLRALARHTQRLRYIVTIVRAGQSIDDAFSHLHPPVFFKMRSIVRTATRIWLHSPDIFETNMLDIYDTEKLIKQGLPAPIMISRCFLTLAERAHHRAKIA